MKRTIEGANDFRVRKRRKRAYLNHINVTMDDLNYDCLEHIFLQIPIMQRIQLRTVCRKWCQIIDRCWRKFRKLEINDKNDQDQLSDEVVDKGREIKMFTDGFELVNNCVSRCGRYLTTLIDGRVDEESILPAACRKCRNLKELVLQIFSKDGDRQLNYLLLRNEEISRLHLFISTKKYYNCLKAVSTSSLENLEIMTRFPEKFEPRMLTDVKKIIDHCTSLKHFACDHMDDEAMKILSEKTTLESLILEASPACNITNNALNYILNMRNLKRLYIETSFDDVTSYQITDDFIVGLSNHCQLLETLTLTDYPNITDNSILTLSKLPHLKELKVYRAFCITDAFLKHLCKVKVLHLLGCWDICDAGVVELLRTSQLIEVLYLQHTNVTNETMIVANQEVQKRMNNIPLILGLCGTYANTDDLQYKSPLLTFDNSLFA